MRELRIYKNETVYYITVRTNNRELLFQDKSDFEFFVETLKSRKEKYGFKLYAYCLLNNHYHLLIEPLGGANISKIMQALNTSYTLYFNKKYNRTGHLVGGRFESRLLNKDSGLLDETMHIHLNSLVLNSSDNYRDYPWSSYGEYIGSVAKPHFRHSEGGQRPTEESYCGLDSSPSAAPQGQNDAELRVSQQPPIGLIDKEYILSFLNLADEQAIKNRYRELIDEEASKKEYVRHSEGVSPLCKAKRRPTEESYGLDSSLRPSGFTQNDDESRYGMHRHFSFRPRFALTLVLVLVLFQFLAPRKIQHGYKYSNSNDFSVDNNYASLVLPKYSGEIKPQEKLVWELWKLGPRE